MSYREGRCVFNMQVTASSNGDFTFDELVILHDIVRLLIFHRL